MFCFIIFLFLQYVYNSSIHNSFIRLSASFTYFIWFFFSTLFKFPPSIVYSIFDSEYSDDLYYYPLVLYFRIVEVYLIYHGYHKNLFVYLFWTLILVWWICGIIMIINMCIICRYINSLKYLLIIVKTNLNIQGQR